MHLNHKQKMGIPFPGIELKAPIDPATTTHIDVKIANNLDSILTEEEHLKTPRSRKSISDSDMASLNSLGSQTHANTHGIPQPPTRNGSNSSHSRLSDITSKMTEFLLSTRHSSSTDHESAVESPVPSRTNSSVSLNLLTRPHMAKRKSFFGRSKSPTRHSHSRENYFKVGPQQQGQQQYPEPPVQPRLKSDNDVKEVHHVKVEYDPITRKRVLNTYEIIKDLGAGQHGKVKLASDLRTGKFVAIKIVDRKNKSTTLERLTRKGQSQTQEDKIRKEIAIMKKCRHPHVVRLLEVLDAEHSRKIYMILEYLEKGEIRWQQLPEDLDGVQEPLLSLSETKRAFRDVVCGLEYLHHQGIIHRDIKPSNLLVDGECNVKISDFGVSFAASLNGEDEFELAKTAGTPAFLAPELCQINCNSSAKVTHKIDIWALGVTLYCLLFGCLPFTAESEFKLFDVINNSLLRFPDMSKWLDAEKLSNHDFRAAVDILNKLLEKDPEKRIDIDEIKNHPFYLEGLSKEQKAHYDGAGWKKDMKIDVSNQEMDEAVVGIGGLIKKKISDMKKAWGHSSSVGSSVSPRTISNSNLLSLQDKTLIPTRLSSMALKDTYSYIFSEAQNTFDTLSHHNDNSDNTTLSLKTDTNTNIASNLDLNIHSYSDPDSEEHLSIDSDVAKETNQLDANNIEKGFDAPLDNESEVFDYRKELEQKEDRLQLTVNPSYASLDSYYDEGYNKFFGGSTSTSYQGYTNSPSPAFNGNVRPQIGSSNGSSMSILRGTVPSRISPPKSTSAISFQQKRANNSVPANMRDKIISSSALKTTFSSSSPVQSSRPISPIIAQRNLIPGRVPSPKVLKPTPRKFSLTAQSASSSASSSSDSEDDQPFMINKKSLASRRYSERRRGNEVDNQPNNSDLKDESKLSSPSEAESSSNKDASQNAEAAEQFTRSSIYGTKINLQRKLPSDSSANSDSGSDDDDELLFNFNRSSRPHPQISADSYQAVPMNSTTRIVANDSICSVANSEVVDVPENIIEDSGMCGEVGNVTVEKDSAGQNNLAYSNVLNDIAVLSVQPNDETPVTDQ